MQRNARQNLGSITILLLGQRESSEELVVRRCLFEKTCFGGIPLAGIVFRDSVNSTTLMQEVQTGTTCVSWIAHHFRRSQPMIAKSYLHPPLRWSGCLFVEGKVSRKTFSETKRRGRCYFRTNFLKNTRRTLTAPNSATAQPLRDLTLKLARKALRTFWVSLYPEDTDDPGKRAMKQDPGWWTVVELLEKHGVGYRSLKAKEAQTLRCSTLSFPQELIMGVGRPEQGLPQSVNQFWDELSGI